MLLPDGFLELFSSATGQQIELCAAEPIQKHCGECKTAVHDYEDLQRAFGIQRKHEGSKGCCDWSGWKGKEEERGLVRSKVSGKMGIEEQFVEREMDIALGRRALIGKNVHVIETVLQP